MGVTIERTKVYQVYLEPKTVRFDAIQSFVSQETPFVEITDSDGLTGRGYSYTIGGGAVICILADNLAHRHACTSTQRKAGGSICLPRSWCRNRYWLRNRAFWVASSRSENRMCWKT